MGGGRRRRRWWWWRRGRAGRKGRQEARRDPSCCGLESLSERDSEAATGTEDGSESESELARVVQPLSTSLGSVHFFQVLGASVEAEEREGRAETWGELQTTDGGSRSDGRGPQPLSELIYTPNARHSVPGTIWTEFAASCTGFWSVVTLQLRQAHAELRHVRPL
eukprot:2862484-Rhodomonas_salina.1